MTSRLLGLMAGTAALALTSSLAQAADLPARMAPPPVAAVPIFTWTGFYVGAQVGFAFSDNNDNNPFFGNDAFVGPDGNTYVIDNNGFFNDDDDNGFTVGGHVGYNFQFGSFVAGVEGDIEWVDIGGNNHGFSMTRIDPLTGVAIDGPFAIRRGNDLEFIGSIRGRLGYAIDRTLLYVTGGVAFASFDDNHDSFAFNSPFFDNGGDDDVEWGWTIGVGAEYAFTNNLTARLEYRFTSFDRNNNNRFFVNTAFDRDNNADFHAVRLGLSYKFGTY